MSSILYENLGFKKNKMPNVLLPLALGPLCLVSCHYYLTYLTVEVTRLALDQYEIFENFNQPGAESLYVLIFSERRKKIYYLKAAFFMGWWIGGTFSVGLLFFF